MTPQIEIYGAKLLFQWRVVENGRAKKRRVCEERVVLIRARSPKDALAQARRYGAQASYADPQLSTKGRKTFFEFVGVVDLDRLAATLGTEYPLEVWYELRERVQPMERRDKLLVPENRMRSVHIPEKRRGRIVL
jgi:hypothetical protein